MLFGCWIAVMLLAAAAAVTRAQSGDGDADTEPRISCTSDILKTGSSLSCKLVGGTNANEDDEDYEAANIRNMTVCYRDYRRNQRTCLEAIGDTISSSDLNPVLHFNITVQPKRGPTVSTSVKLTNIVKPRSPLVKNVTFDLGSNQAVIRIQIPYHKDYLRLDNQLFQLLMWTAGGSPETQNISSDTLNIHMDRLHKHTQYHVKVRAIPVLGLKGTWSDWSDTFTFITPNGDLVVVVGKEENVQKQTDEGQETYTLMVCLIILVVVPSCVVFFWKYKIFTYLWPSIPHPKHTLVQICNPHKSVLLNLKPEEFSALKVEKSEPCEESSIAAAADPCPPRCSSQTSSSCSRNTTSVGTEELELSALLSWSSSDRDNGLQSAGPSPVHVLQTPQPEGSGGGHEAEAYVTMSSFYQIK